MRLTLKLKLATVFVLLIATSAGMMVVSLHNMGMVNARLAHLLHGEAERLRLAGELSRREWRVHGDVRDYLIATSPEDLAHIKARLVNIAPATTRTWPLCEPMRARRDKRFWTATQRPSIN